MLCPIVTIAKVPAAVACVRPKISWRSIACKRKHNCANHAAKLLPNNLVPIITTATNKVVHPLHTTLISIIRPTPIRKSGTKIFVPTKLICFITGLRLGTKRLSIAPQRNAPKILSKPAHSAKYAEMTIIAITSIKPIVVSLLRLKTNCAIRGKSEIITAQQITTRKRSNSVLLSAPNITLLLSEANTKSERVIAGIVPPTAILAAIFFCTPYRLRIG